LDVQAENLPLDIIFEDEDILVVNKPQGMVVHPAPGAWNGTMVNALLYHCQSLSGINGVIRPGIVHCIDKDTSGLLVVAKNDEAHHQLAGQINAHSVGRSYRAVVHGVLSEPSGTDHGQRQGSVKDRRRWLLSSKKPRRSKHTMPGKIYSIYGDPAVLKAGRTHQIRVI
jgi:23S rRNA pseudouridine1911/1915/1917 synthase